MPSIAGFNQIWRPPSYRGLGPVAIIDKEAPSPPYDFIFALSSHKIMKIVNIDRACVHKAAHTNGD